MLPQTITLDTGVVYTRFETVGNDKLVYHGPNHTDIIRDTLEFIRTAPKRSGVNYGVRRGYIRFTRDAESTQSDGSTRVEPHVLTISENFPVGMDNTANATVIDMISHAMVVLGGTQVSVDDVLWDSGTAALLVDFFTEGAL